MPGFGEEAATIGSAAAVQKEDLLMPQYREQGAVLYRGFSIEDMAHQLAGNYLDITKSR